VAWVVEWGEICIPVGYVDFLVSPVRRIAGCEIVGPEECSCHARSLEGHPELHNDTSGLSLNGTLHL